MARISKDKIFVMAGQRLDGIGSRSYYRVEPYVRLYLDGHVVNLDASVARQLARGLTAYAKLIDPPKPRK